MRLLLCGSSPDPNTLRSSALLSRDDTFSHTLCVCWERSAVGACELSSAVKSGAWNVILGGRCSRNVLSFGAEAHPHWGELGLCNIMRVLLWLNKLKQIFGVFPPACQLQDAFSVFRPEASVSQQHHCLLLLWITSSHMCWAITVSSWGWVVFSQPWCTHMYTIQQYWQWRANRGKHLEIFLAWLSSDPVVSVLAGIE